MRRKWIPGLIGLIIVVGCVLGFKQYMNSVRTDVTMMETWKPVKMIQAGQMITSDMIHKVQIPTVQHMGNALLERSQIVGKRTIIPIGETEEFLSWKIGPDALFPTGDEDYIGFKIDFVGAVNNMVRRGDKVTAWVEYTVPKVFDDFGNEITDAQQAALLAANPNLTFKKVYTNKLLENLTVAYIKDQEGIEITDATSSGPISLPLSSDQKDVTNSDRYRQNASGQPSYITFIMSPEQYETFAAGAKDGNIRLGLPNMMEMKMIGTISKSKNDHMDEKDSSKGPVKMDNNISITPDQSVPASQSPSNQAGNKSTPVADSKGEISK
ncbi:hypothetical protein [Cohnella soli]|uniref:SAF domain-containing protein n=1 Tax=Cohnella soli TaxID=425005 RepID=A0ABW0HMG3_9BACL